MGFLKTSGLTLILVVVVVLAIYPLPRLIASSSSDWAKLGPNQRFDAEASVRTALLQGAAGILVLLGAITALRQLSLAREQADASHDAQYVVAFTRAVEQLVGDRPSTRVAGVYVLDRLGASNPQEWPHIAALLMRYVREEGSRADSGGAIEAAIFAITNRREGLTVDLSGADLSGKRLAGVDLSGARLTDCDMRETDLNGALLTGADLRGADLSRAILTNCELTDAALQGCRTTGAVGMSE
jgi:uncharacterized protein YjbI with pentapeptide repeats